MPVITTTFGRNFPQSDSQTILDAAAQSGVALPYSCKTGRCSTCKCKVLKGESHAKSDELGLTDAEKDEGWVLSCVRTATTELTIEVEDLTGVILPKVQTQPARITSLEKLASDVLRVKFRLPPTSNFSYLPGQYIDVIGPGGVRRSYSVANTPAGDKQLELHVRAVEGGVMSGYWFEAAKINDLVRLNGPLGSFFLRPLKGVHLVFLATGTGIAPVKSMLEHLATSTDDNQPLSITVYWGAREAQDLYCDPANLHPKLRYVPVLSRADQDWVGACGYVQDAMLNDAPDLGRTVVYACGSDAMIHSAQAKLTKAGLPAQHFYSDAFVCSASS